MQPLLVANDLHTYFYTESGVVRAVNGVSFAIMPGQTLGMLGESGSGKSITGYSMLGLIAAPGRIVRGEILYYGSGEPIDLVRLDPKGEAMRQIRGREIAMIFQEPMSSLDPLFNVESQLTEAILAHEKVSKRAARSRAEMLLEKVRLPEPRELLKRYPHQLSGGMRQRVMIAIALACQPKLLIADEPTTALDATIEAQILELLRDLQREFNMAMLFITHDLGVIADMADEAVVMYAGQIVERADTFSLFSSPKHPYTQALLASIPRIAEKTDAALAIIKGMVPSPLAMPPGCAFHPRCAHFMPGVCDTRVPTPVRIDDQKTVSCFLYEAS